MAVFEKPDLRLINDEDGKLRPETIEEYKDRLKKQAEKQYDIEIKEIMEFDFTRKQAKYIHKMKRDFYNAIQPKMY